MKRLILLGISITITSLTFAQTQIANSDFELWENVSSGQEPNNWNSFMTASGSLNGNAAVQVQSSTDVRPGSTGTYSARINARSVFGIIANGNCTLGKVNMGSISPANSANYNASITADANFSEVLTNSPDSIVFWAKFISGNNSTTAEARVKATIHDAYDYRDPEDAASTSHVVATALVNYTQTNNAWVRFSVPFVYSGPATSAQYILVTFTTNKIPGSGDAGDLVYMDDMQLIYNPSANQQMTANNDNFSGPQDNDIICDVLANDTDPEGMINASTVMVTTNPTNGTVAVDGGNGVITYTPNPGYSGADSFIYNVCDQGSPATCDQATVSINVNFTSIEENSITKLQVKSFGNNLVFGGADKFDGTYVVYNLTGEMIQKGKLASQVAFNEKSGVYLVSVITSAGTVTKRIYKN